jgi:small-conductance mechanosensitive channel
MSLQDLQDLLQQISPTPWARATVIVASSMLVAALVNALITRIALRITARTRTTVDDQLVQALRSPVFVSIVLAGVSLGMLVGQVGEPLYRYGLASLKTLAILVWMIFASRVARLFLEVVSRHRDRFEFVQPQTLPALGNLANAFIFGGAVYFFFLSWSIDISAWVASAGIIGLAVSLAAKDTLANLFAGLAILADNPYRLGDYIVLSTGERGEVTQIGIRSSRILTRDDIEIIVPNSLLANSKIVNEAGGPNRHYRVRCKVSVAYGSDVDQVRRVLEEIALSEPETQDDPAPRVRLRLLGDSGLELELLAWVPDPWMRGRVLDRLNTAVYKRFHEEGIEIPYPKRDVFLHTAPEGTVPPVDREG